MKKISAYLVLNRIFVFVVAYLLSGTKPLRDFLLTFGNRWDGNSYTFIANNWYTVRGSPGDAFIVFPPLYPLSIKFLSLLGINPSIAGLIIANIFFILAMLLLYELVSRHWNKDVAEITILLISIFPTTYFFSATYPESLFIFLLVVSFYLAERKKYLFASIIGGLAAITRPFGLIIFPSIFLFILKGKNSKWKRTIFSAMLFSIPVFYYLWINYTVYGNALAFTEFLSSNWQKSFDFPWNGIVSSWKRGMFTRDSFEYKYIVGYSEAIASTIAWVLAFIGIKKWKKKLPYLSYILLGTVLFTSTGFILSAPRYLLSIPFFFVLAGEIFSQRRIFLYLWIPVSLGLFVYFLQLFGAGRWVF